MSISNLYIYIRSTRQDVVSTGLIYKPSTSPPCFCPPPSLNFHIELNTLKWSCKPVFIGSRKVSLSGECIVHWTNKPFFINRFLPAQPRWTLDRHSSLYEVFALLVNFPFALLGEWFDLLGEELDIPLLSSLLAPFIPLFS